MNYFVKRIITTISLLLAFLVGPGVGNASNDNVKQVLLKTLWRVKVGGADYMMSQSTSERDLYPSDGAIFYVAKGNIPGTAPLYRLLQTINPPPDHMVRGLPGDGNYITEGIIGYPWTSGSSSDGLYELIRVHNGLHGGHDHALTMPGETLTDYDTLEPMALYGYKRSNLQDTNLVTVSGGGVSASSNMSAGGAIWSWIWNGIEFVNTYDYGREIQTAVFFYDSEGNVYDPTEAGDLYSSPYRQPQDRHGSPVVQLGPGIGSPSTIRTRSVPLTFVPTRFPGGGDLNPIIYPGLRIGKDLYLNYANMGPVAKYVTHVVSQEAITDAVVEIPTGYLGSSFNRFWTYDAATDILSEVHPSDCNGNPTLYGWPGDLSFGGYGGVIISNSNGSAAMGQYGVSDSVGGDVHGFALYSFLYGACSGDPRATSKFNAVYTGQIDVGDNSFTTWLINGSVTSVASKMQTLYQSGVQ